jgi:hypothetical protein
MAEDRTQSWAAVEAARSALEQALANGTPRERAEAQIAYDLAQAHWEEAATEAQRVAAIPAPEAPKQLNAQVYPFPGAQAEEQASTAGGLFPLPPVGVCLSGGGSRSASASMGALRGLRYLGLLDKVTYLSTVSGGGWAGTLYTYCPDAISDDVLLGPVVADPGKLTWYYWGGDRAFALDQLSPYALGSLCTRIGIVPLIESVVDLYENQNVPVEALWNRAIGKLVLEPFGLGDHLANGHPTMYYSYTPWWRDNVVRKNNRGLAPGDFYLTQTGQGRTHRPYLITNSTFFYPPAPDTARAILGRSRAVDPSSDPYPFEATPITVGMPPTFAGAGAGGRDLGGGYVDPFAFGSIAPAKPPVNNDFSVPTPAARFALSDIAGTSSSAYVDVLINNYSSYYPWIEDLDPTYTYWPVSNAGAPRNTATPYLFGDGGLMENSGIMALLRRHVPNILSFVNVQTPLSLDAALPPGRNIVVDDVLPPLFGLLPYEKGVGYRPLAQDPTSLYRYNQVFSTAAFWPLISALWQAASTGGTAMFKQRQLVAMPNARFGIAGGDIVDVLWIYNNPVPKWYAQLSEEVRIGMDVDVIDFYDFPNYQTISQLNLNARQVNLLAHLSTWNVIDNQSYGGLPSNRSRVASMFGGG